jgi:hypothetical protein
MTHRLHRFAAVGIQSVTPLQTDTLISRYLGDSLQTGTMRLVGGIVAAAAVLALLVWLI